MDCILRELEAAKEKQLLNGEIGTTERKLCYGLSKAILESHMKANPWLNRDVLNNYKRRKEKIDRPLNSVNITGVGDSVSDLSDPTDVSKTSPNENNPNEVNSTTADEMMEELPKKGGRPKGKTNEAKRSDTRKMQRALNHAALESLSVKEEAIKNGNARVQRGAYKKIIEATEKAFNLEVGSINMDTVLKRLQPGRKVVTTGKGSVSPLIAVEAHFVDVLLQLAAMRQPLTAHGALNLINSMITGSNLQEHVVEWKQKHKVHAEDNGNIHKLGIKYWQNFKKRHPEINTKRAVKFDSKRDDWCTFDNFEKMYQGVYAAMVKSNVAIKLPEKTMVKLDGTRTEKKEESVRRETKLQPKTSWACSPGLKILSATLQSK